MNKQVEARLRLERAETERDAALKALTETNQLRETILDHTHMLVAYLDPQFNFIRVNRAYAKADEREPSFFPGKNHFELYPNAENEEIFRGVVETGEPYFAYGKPFEYAEHPERGVSYWDWNLVPVKNPEGIVVALVLMIMDITKRKQIEVALEERLQFESLLFELSATFANLPAGDIDKEIEHWLQRLSEFLDVDRSSLFEFEEDMTRARAAYVFVAPGIPLPPSCPTQAQFPYIFEKLRRGQVFMFSGVDKLPDEAALEKTFFIEEGVKANLTIPLRVGQRALGLLVFATLRTARAWPDDLVQRLRLVGEIFTNVLMHRGAEKELKRHRDHLEEMVSERTAELEKVNEQLRGEIAGRRRAQEELLRLNEDLTILNQIAMTLSQSPNLDHILNTTLDQVLAIIQGDAGWIYLFDEGQDEKRLSLAVHRGLSQKIVKAAATIPPDNGLISRVLQTGYPVVRVQVPEPRCFGVAEVTGETLHACALVPLKSHDRVLGVLGVFNRSPRELTSQEIQLLSAVGHQIGVAAENIRLIKEAADAAILNEVYRLRSELIANVSHELRTPLGLIKIFVTSLLRKKAGFDRETRAKFLQGIEAESIKLEEIIDNLLDQGRIESGRLRLEKHRTDLAELAWSTVEAMQAQAEQHRFGLEFPSGPLVASVDAKRIEQVLGNLLSNAVKYSPEGGTITIQGYRDKRQVSICISDEGIGIPVEEQKRIFERFYRVDNAITKRTRGVGLGLAVCQGIIEAHGGRLWVESIPGQGSAFCFSLPSGD